MGLLQLFTWLALAMPVASRWCQVENVKADVYQNYSFAGPWHIDGCTTLSLDHGYCAELDCPWRIKFEDEAIVELADQLHGNSALTALSLASNKMSNEGVLALAEALRDNEMLNDLNLAGNEISDQGALALADVLASNAVCTTLNLEHNQITDEGGRALLELLKSNESALETLHIGNNQISADIVAEAEDQNQAAFRPPTRGDTPQIASSRDEL
jgi:hypothetical protein